MFSTEIYLIQYYKDVEKFQVASSKEAWQLEKYHWIYKKYLHGMLVKFLISTSNSMTKNGNEEIETYKNNREINIVKILT